jgi:AraC family transcriptional regulator of adaptative response / methylphosphotriester-DNA alkyltransferase methyltransferase
MATTRETIQRSTGGRKTLSPKTRDRRVQAIRVLLEGSFHRKLGLREMSETVNLSPWRLAHLFKSETGMSPQRYLTLVRLQRAKDQLESTFLSIQEIGAAVGIPNPSQFTKSFKAAYGMTPVEYRKTHFDAFSIVPDSGARAMTTGSNNASTSKE